MAIIVSYFVVVAVIVVVVVVVVVIPIKYQNKKPIVLFIIHNYPAPDAPETLLTKDLFFLSLAALISS